MNRLIIGCAMCTLALLHTAFASSRLDALESCTVSGAGRKDIAGGSLESLLSIWSDTGIPSIPASVTRDGVAIFADVNAFRRFRGIDLKYGTNDVSGLMWSDIRDLNIVKSNQQPLKSAQVSTLQSVFMSMAGRPERRLCISSQTIPLAKIVEAAEMVDIFPQIYLESGRYKVLKDWKKASVNGKSVLALTFWPPNKLDSESAKGLENRLEKLFRNSEKDAHAAVDVARFYMAVEYSTNSVPRLFPSEKLFKEMVSSFHAKNVRVEVYLWRTENFNRAYKLLWDMGVDSFLLPTPAAVKSLREKLSGVKADK